jgi:simple sugar transport system substrate-binding protein/basic membrane protein A
MPSAHLTRRRVAGVALLLSSGLVLSGCGSDSEGTTTPSTTPAAAGTTSATAAPSEKLDGTVGFIFVGPKTDFGYNQAAYEASQKVADDLGVKVLTQENVPEDDNAARVMEGMISRGAKLIFATSYGHLQAAQKVAAAHPDVVVVQQGNVIKGAIPKNLGTYFGTVYEPVYAAGIAAGKATKTGKLGYVYAFGIPQTLNNINAFELGAQSVNPTVQTYAVNTSAWCDPQKQKAAVDSLLSQDVDVISQHQDCTDTIIKATEAAGKFSVGYHADASSLAPNGWLTGSEWNWAPLYEDIVKTALSGAFAGSKYNANYRVGLQTGENPFISSKFGPAVDAATQALETTALAKFKAGGSPFTGPITGQDGSVKVAAGTTLAYGSAEIEGMDFFVKGVVGDIPK